MVSQESLPLADVQTSGSQHEVTSGLRLMQLQRPSDVCRMQGCSQRQPPRYVCRSDIAIWMKDVAKQYVYN